MKHLGDYDPTAVIYGKFTTYQPSTGAAFALGGSAALSVYKDNSVTQSTSGVTLTVSFDSVTGLNHFAIDTSSDGTFYAAGSFFDIVITTGTVDGVSVVGAVVASFSLQKVSALRPATAGRTLVVDASGLADANAVKLGPTGSGTAQTARDIGASVLVGDKTGFSLSSGGVQAIWDALTSALTTAGSIGKLLVDKIDATISSRLATSGYTTPPTAATVAGAVWDVTLSGHLTSGSTGAALNAAGAAGDPWSTAIPGAYGAGTAGFIVGTNLDAAVSTRLATSGYTAPPTANQNADALLDRTDGIETSRTPRQGFRLMLAALAGKLSGAATTTVSIRDTNDSKNRIVATVDADGNRSAVTYDAS